MAAVRTVELKKTAALLLRRERAGGGGSGPALPVARHPIVEGVAEGAGDHQEQAAKRPGKPKAARDAQDGRGAGADAVAFDQHHGVGGGIREAVAQEQRLPGGGLAGGKAQNTPRVVPEHEADRAVADAALPIVHHDGVGGAVRISGVNGIRSQIKRSR